MILEIFAGVAIMVGIVLATWMFANQLIEYFRPTFVETHLTLPLIGNQGCKLIPVGQDAPQGSKFGMPGLNNLGCFVETTRMYAVLAAIGMFILAMLIAFFSGMRDKIRTHGKGGTIMGAMLDKGVESLLLIIVIIMWPTILDMASSTITYGAVAMAASPWGDSKGDYNSIEQNAQRTVSFMYDSTRDPGLGSIDCMKLVDKDHDGYYDSTDYNLWCFMGKVATMTPSDWVNAFLMFIFTSFVSITMILTSNTLMTLRILMTGALIGIGPLFLVFSRLPLVGKLGQLVMQTLVGLMIAPLIVAPMMVVGHDMINSEVIHLHAKGVPEASIKFTTYIMAIGVIAATMTSVVIVAGPLAPMLISLPTVMAGAVTQVMNNATRAGMTLTSGAVGAHDENMGRMIKNSGNIGLQLMGYGGGIDSYFPGAHRGGGGDTSDAEIEQELADGGGGYGDRYEDLDYGDHFSPGDSGNADNGGNSGKVGGDNAAI